jgi:PAS domain S-box-containing protein
MPDTNLSLGKPPDEKPVNLLLVDDQPANLLVLEAILADLGANLVKAPSGEEALRKLLKDDFAAILLDIQMQGMDGFETAKLIRSREKSRYTPIIFLTAYESHRLPVEAAYALGAVDYLVKPLVPVILRAKVAGFVELYQKTAKIKFQAEQIRQMERREFERQLAEERRLAEEVLRDSEQRFARFMQNLAGLAWIKDLQGRYVYVNEAAEKAFGVSRANLYGKTDAEVFSPEIAGQFQENDRRALDSGANVQVVETLTHEDGTKHYSLVSKFPILGSDGKPTLVGGMAIDITDRMRAEEALKEADRRKDEFLAMLAHELRNPLAPIRNALHILKMPGASAEVVKRSMDMMERQVHHLVRLVDDLLDVSRIMRDKIELRKERIELAQVVARAVETVQPTIHAREHELTVILPPEPLWLQADMVRLAQVVGNLLNNAAKYTEKGGRIFLSAKREGSEVVLRIKDTGMGIEPEMLPRIFGLFVQVERAMSLSQGGMGVGLALARKLVEMHRGTVQAFSEGPGKGSEFIVRLPVLNRTRQGDVQHTEEVETHPGPAGASLRILVVDDNQDAGETLAMLLRLEGHEVRVAKDAYAALEQMKTYQPAVAFLDLGMPGMDGYELCRRLREQTRQEPLFLVALTGWGQEEDRRRSQEAGFDRHLVKPVEPQSLKRLLTHPKLGGSGTST